jgi:hypothetical protein
LGSASRYFLIYLRTLARRKEPHIYVSNWYYMAFILVVAILQIVNNLAVPVSLGHAKSYSAFSGVQDAMTQWWYGHNAVAFFLTAGFLGMMYYFLPVQSGRPIFSYRLSIISFWGHHLFLLVGWIASPALHGAAMRFGRPTRRGLITQLDPSLTERTSHGGRATGPRQLHGLSHHRPRMERHQGIEHAGPECGLFLPDSGRPLLDRLLDPDAGLALWVRATPKACSASINATS